MLKRCTIVLFFSIFLNVCLRADIEIYFGPKGGFSVKNNQRTIVLKDGKIVTATPNNVLQDMIERTEEGDEIKIAMYSFSYKPIQELLVAAVNRGVKVKVLLDGTSEWTKEMRADFQKLVMEDMAKAGQEKRAFDFQIKEVMTKNMSDRGRSRTLKDGTVIYGTMHQKFGVFYRKETKIPLHAFCGTANISWPSSETYAENRIFFTYEPTVAQQLAEEFARLWNEYGTPITPNCQPERFIPIHPNWGDVQLISNSKALDEVSNQKIDEIILKLLNQVDKKSGSLDIAMFSFTHNRIANQILFLASRNKGIKVRMLLDQTQIEENKTRVQGLLGPYMEGEIQKRQISNIEIRYKWRSNAVAWDDASKSCMVMSRRSLFLHHKCIVVNKTWMGIGSYNWSDSAEARNFENIMIVNGELPRQKQIVDRFLAEFDTIWNSTKSLEPITKKIGVPQVVTGEYGRKLKALIQETYSDPACREIMAILDRETNCSLESFAQKLNLTEKDVEGKLNKLVACLLIFANKENDGNIKYQLTD